VLAAAGFEAADMVFIDIAFADLADLPAVNRIVAEQFAAGSYPARTIYQAAALPYGGKVKIMGVATKA
jgi:2-iminobutanoate/2-iminopropanoate deaminase